MEAHLPLISSYLRVCHLQYLYYLAVYYSSQGITDTSMCAEHCSYSAGSKIRITSMINMAVELLAVLLGYQVGRLWSIKTEAEV